MIEKTMYLNKLYDLYGVLLTEKQKEYFELYYLEDLSLQEIAENKEISRNAVHRQLKNVEKLLEDYESKLKLGIKNELLYELYERLKEIKEDELLKKLDKVL